MRKFLCLMVVFLSGLFFSSCERDSLISIVGSWKSLSYTIDYYVNDKLSETTTEYANSEEYEIFSFKQDDTFTYADISGTSTSTLSGTYFITRENLVLTIKAKDGATATGSMGWKISSLTWKQLVLMQTEIEVKDGHTYKSVESITFVRV